MNSIQPGYKTIWAISRELMNQFVEKLIGRTLCFGRETLLYFRDSNCWKLNNRIISFEITLFIKSLQYNGLPCQISKYDTSERQGLNLQVLFQLSATYFTCTDTNMYCANIWWRKMSSAHDSGFYIFIHLFMYLDGKKIFPMKWPPTPCLIALNDNYFFYINKYVSAQSN